MKLTIDAWVTLYPTPSPKLCTDIILATFPMLHNVPAKHPGAHMTLKWKGGKSWNALLMLRCGMDMDVCIDVDIDTDTD